MKIEMSELVREPVEFCMNWTPGIGLEVKLHGHPYDAMLLAHMAMVQITLNALKPEHKNMEYVHEMLENTLNLACAILKSGDTRIIDLKEMRKQAQEGGESHEKI
ncbi:hypothetical protein [Gemmiger formicilis]|uniref:hypothetical protein n=1 Tax=Gemmiger formicilis TaxID=745368 RepID=UPI003CCAD95D